MDIILPDILNEKKFLAYASQIQYDEFNAVSIWKLILSFFAFINKSSGFAEDVCVLHEQQ